MLVVEVFLCVQRHFMKQWLCGHIFFVCFLNGEGYSLEKYLYEAKELSQCLSIAPNPPDLTENASYANLKWSWYYKTCKIFEAISSNMYAKNMFFCHRSDSTNSLFNIC